MNNIKMVLFDIDNTLIFGEKASTLYAQYSVILENTLAKLLGVTHAAAKQIADEHRAQHGGRGELAFETCGYDLTYWHDALIQLTPSNYLEPLPQTQKLLEKLRSEKYIVGAITDGPELLIEKLFSATRIDPASFDFIIGWKRGKQMPKYGLSTIFEQVCDSRNIARNETIMIGDSMGSDIIPAKRAGLQTLHIGTTISDVTQLINYL